MARAGIVLNLIGMVIVTINSQIVVSAALKYKHETDGNASTSTINGRPAELLVSRSGDRNRAGTESRIAPDMLLLRESTQYEAGQTEPLANAAN